MAAKSEYPQQLQSRSRCLALQATLRRLALWAVLFLGSPAAPWFLTGCQTDRYCLTCGLTEGGGGEDDQASRGHSDGGSKSADAGPRPTDATLEAGTVVLPGCASNEACNHADDDCDGEIDEGFDLATNPLHCGACGRVCQADHAEAMCVDGACAVGLCLDGYADFDQTTGCEYRCPVFPTREEDCNGIDDDCDGEVDETLLAPPAAADLCRVTPGTPCADTLVACKTIAGRTFWACNYGDQVEFDPEVANGIVVEESLCDGFDGDCDGLPDDPWQIGESCNDAEHGACLGTWVCVADDPTDAVCSFEDLGPAAPETCNGADDDCDGEVDEDVVDDMVHITSNGMDFYIYRHEASRPDATATAQGVSTARSCGRAGVLPWTFATYEAARRACQAAGKRLCTAPEWTAACAGESSRAYPYGSTYDPSACNGADYGPANGMSVSVVRATGSLSSCSAGSGGPMDLSGNVKEWTADLRGDVDGTPIYVVRGGSFQSPELGLTCATDLAQAAAFPGHSALGFRCCANGVDRP